MNNVRLGVSRPGRFSWGTEHARLLRLLVKMGSADRQFHLKNANARRGGSEGKKEGIGAAYLESSR